MATQMLYAVSFLVDIYLFRRFRKSPDVPAADGAESEPWTPEPLGTMAALQALLASESERNLAFILKVDRMKVRAWQGQLDAAGGEVVEGTPDPEPEPVRVPALNGSGA